MIILSYLPLFYLSLSYHLISVSSIGFADDVRIDSLVSIFRRAHNNTTTPWLKSMMNLNITAMTFSSVAAVFAVTMLQQTNNKQYIYCLLTIYSLTLFLLHGIKDRKSTSQIDRSANVLQH